MYNGRTIEAATQVDVGVHRAITKRMYVTSVVLFAVGLAGFIGTFIPYMMTDVMDSYLIIIEVCIVLAVVGAVLMMRLRSSYRNTAARGSALQTFSFHKDGVIATVLFPGAAQTPYPKMYYNHAKKVRICGKGGAYLVFNYGRVMYPVYMASLTEMEKYTILTLFGKKPGWIKRHHVKYAGPALELEGGQEYRAVSGDDIFDMNQPPEDDVFDIGSAKSQAQGSKAPVQSAGGPKPAPVAKPAEDNPFKDHYWDTPDEDDPFDLGSDSDDAGALGTSGKSPDGSAETDDGRKKDGE